MALFSRQPKPLVPRAILGQLNAFGRASWEAKLASSPVTDSRFDWMNFFTKFLPAYQTDLPRAIAEVHAHAGADLMSRYGGYRLIAEFDGSCQDPLYLDMMDAALEMMSERGLSRAYMTGYESQRWAAKQGGVA